MDTKKTDIAQEISGATRKKRFSQTEYESTPLRLTSLLLSIRQASLVSQIAQAFLKVNMDYLYCLSNEARTIKCQTDIITTIELSLVKRVGWFMSSHDLCCALVS